VQELLGVALLAGWVMSTSGFQESARARAAAIWSADRELLVDDRGDAAFSSASLINRAHLSCRRPPCRRARASQRVENRRSVFIT